MRIYALIFTFVSLAEYIRQSIAGLPYSIETFDNYGRQNNYLNTRPLNGWIPHDDKNAGVTIQSNWRLTTWDGDSVVAHLSDAQYLRTGGTTTTYACDGLGGGSQLVNTKIGAFLNFKRLSVDFYPDDDDMVGLVWNFQRLDDQVTPTPTTVPLMDANIRGYYLVFRNDSVALEQCYGAYKSVKQVPTSYGKSVASEGKTYALNTWNTLTVSKDGNVMNWNLYAAGIKNISGSFTDTSGSPLGAGFLGLVASQMNGVYFDNFIVIDDPKCNDGILNGEEEGPDCGLTACGVACADPLTMTHTWATNGIVGWETHMYGSTTDAGRWFIESDLRMWQRANHGTDHTSGTNCINAWQGSYLMARHWGIMYDFDFEISFTAVDNDNMGLIIRFLDADNFIMVLSNDEESCVTVRKRAGGVDTQLPNVYQFGNGTNSIGTNGVRFKASPTSSTITTVWKVVARGNSIQWYMNSVLIYTAIDTEPGIGHGAGLVGLFQQRTSGVGWMNPTVTVRSRVPSKSTAATSNTMWGALGLRTTMPSAMFAFAGSNASVSTTFTAPTIPLVMHLDSAVLATRTTLRVWPDQSGFGNPVFTYRVRASAAPPSVTRAPYEYPAVNFNGASWLTAFPTQELNPLSRGITIFLAMKPTIAASAYILSLGYRAVQTNQMVGFRFAQLPTASPTMTVGAVGFQQVFQHGRRNFSPSVDATLPISFSRINVVALRLMPEPFFGSTTFNPYYSMTVMTGRRVEQMNVTYGVLATNVTFPEGTAFAGMNDAPISLMGAEAYFQLAAAEDGVSQRFNGNIYDVLVYSGAITTENMTSILTSLSNKHGANGCVAINLNATNARMVPYVGGTSVASNCLRANAGDRCELACATSALIPVAGSFRLTCLDSGLWDGNQLSCQASCPSIVVDDAGKSGCSYGPAWDFNVPGIVGLQSDIPSYRLLAPSQPYGDLKWIASNGMLNVTGFAGSFTDVGMLSLLPGAFTETTATALNITTRIASWNNAGGVARLYFRSDAAAANGYFVEIDVLRDSVRLIKIVASTPSVLTCSGVRGKSLKLGEFVHVRVLTTGISAITGILAGTIQVFIDDSIFCNVVDSTFVVGTVALAVTGSTDAAFDDFSVHMHDRTKCTGCRSLSAGNTCSMSCNPGFVMSKVDGPSGCADNGTLVNEYVCTMPPPVFTNQTFSVKELVTDGTAVGRLNATSVVSGFSLTYVVSSGNTGGAFSVDGCSGILSVANTLMLDYEMVPPGLSQFSLRVVAAVLGYATASTEAWITIIVDNADDPPSFPTSLTFSIREDAAVNAFIGAIPIVDPEGDAWQASLEYGNIGNAFRVSSTGGLYIETAGVLDFETNPTIRLLVKATSATNVLVSTSNFVTVTITDANDAPVITLPIGATSLQLEVPARDVIAGVQVGAPLSAIDPDVGDKITWSWTPVSGTPLVTIFTTFGTVIITVTRIYAPGSEYILDNRLIVDMQTLSLTATDTGGFRSTVSATVYIMANVTSSSPIIRSMSVVSAEPAAGSGSILQSGGGVTHLLSTSGDDAVVFTIDNLAYNVENHIVANVTSVSTGIGWIVNCAWSGIPYVSSALGITVMDSITCPSKGAWGKGYQWSLKLVRISDSAVLSNLLSSIVPITDYAPPLIAVILGESSDCLRMSTIGGDVIRVQGFNFGPLTATDFTSGKTVSRPLIVTYGPVATGPDLYAASKFSPVGSLSNDNVRILFDAVPGVGMNLEVSVSLAGQMKRGGPANIIAYAPAFITSASVVGAISSSDKYYLSTEGGRETLLIAGGNFGPAAGGGSQAAPALYYGPVIESFPLRFTSICSQNADATAHNTLRCPVAPGIGRNLTLLVVVGGQQGDRSSGPAAEVSYTPSRVSTIYGPSGCDTRGDQVIYLDGNFGPTELSQGGDAPLVAYGPITAPRKHMAKSCVMLGTTGQVGQIQCYTTEGVGANLTATVYLGSQWGIPGGNFAYAPPILSSFELDKVLSPGTTDADTLGFQDVIIYGSQFGPSMDGITVLYSTRISDVSDSANASLTAASSKKLISFTPPVACRKPSGFGSGGSSLAHTQMICTTAAGAGRDLVWSIVVSGQASSNPVTNYRMPVITAVTLNDNTSPVSGVSTEGGILTSQYIHIQGNGFGPSVTPGPLVQEVRVGDPSVLDTSLAYVPKSINLLSDGRLAIVLPPGIGQSLRVRVRVADVWSLISPSPTGALSYALPSITSISPTTTPTLPSSGSSTLRIMGTNFGLLDPSVEHYVMFGSKKLMVQNRYPALFSVQSGNLTADETNSANHYLETLIPEGVGVSIGVKVVSFRRDAPSLSSSSSPAVDGASTWFTYASPSIKNFGVESVTGPTMINQSYSFFGDTVDVESVRILSLVGSNFGPSKTAGAFVEILPVDANGVPVIGATYSSSNIGFMSWSHDSIKLMTTNMQGLLRISIPSTNPQGVALPPQTSNAIIFMDVLPSINNIQGTPLEGYPTIGGSILVLAVGNLQAANMVSVVVGNRTCPLVDDADQLIPLANIKSAVLDSQANARDPMTPLSKFIWTLRCMLPEGQGSRATILVYRDQVSGTNVDMTVRYSSPTLTSALLWDPLNSVYVNSTAPSDNDAVKLRIPTSGGMVKIVGNNFGVCPFVLFGVHRGAACAADKEPLRDTLLVLSYSHSHMEVRIPEGFGSGTSIAYPDGYAVLIVAEDQILSVSSRYALPSLDPTPSVAFSSSQKILNSGGLDYFPTAGGVVVSVKGTNFGSLSAPMPILNFMLQTQGGTSTRLEACKNVVRDPSYPHTLLTCTLPEGSGKLIRIQMRVGEADQMSVSTPIFSYTAPSIQCLRYGGPAPANTPGFNITSNLSPSALKLLPSEATSGTCSNPVSPVAISVEGPTTGGVLLYIDGADFGPYEPESGHCISLSATSTTPINCNGQLESWDEGEIASVYVVSWTHNNISLIIPPGMGKKVIRIMSRLQESSVAANNIAFFRYSNPVIFSTTPNKGSTEGNEDITLRGFNFGFGPSKYDNANRGISGPSATPMLQFPASLPLPSWAYTAGLPTQQPMRVNFFSATRCVSTAVKSDSSPIPDYSFPLCSHTILLHTHDTIIFKSLPGIGAHKNVSISIVDFDPTIIITSNNANFSYLPPEVVSVEPNLVLLSEAKIDENGFQASVDKRLKFRGRYFGGTAGTDTSEWTAQDREVIISIGGLSCRDADRVQTENLLQCFYGNPAGPASSVSRLVPTVGHKNVSVFVAGQRSVFNLDANSFTPAFPVNVVCDKGFYGLPGETCLACPRGATCNGYIQELEDSVKSVFIIQSVMVGFTDSDNPTGSLVYQNVTECVSCHTPPVADPGFFNMKGYVNKQGVSESLCHPVRIKEKLRTTAQCDYIVACDPPESCLAANVCADGYANKEWPYRCSQCAAGYYRSAGSCTRCPNNPILNIVFFFLFAIVGIAVGYTLNRKMVNIAFLAIGLDYFQVISIFANTRVAWPPQLKELFRILSAFNLNIELIAPECAIPDVTYSQKWYAVMGLPLAVTVMLLSIHLSSYVFMKFVRGHKAKFFGAEGGSALIAMALTLMYFLYLYLTRSVFDILTCRSTDPPEYDANGQEIPYMTGVFERCGVPGGTQLSLLPAAVAALIIYVLAYPAMVAYILWMKHELVMEDQLLRAKGVGDDKLTNPHAYGIRRAFGRLYYQFTPSCYLWILAILLRKFLIALCALIFAQNQTFQLAAILLVLFLAYTAQTRYQPYMSPRETGAVLDNHRMLARQGDLLNMKLAAGISTVEARGRKRTFFNNVRNTSNGRNENGIFFSTSSISSVAMNAFVFLTSYNTVESLLLASALLVALSGIMFSTAISTSAFYSASRDAVLASAITLIIISALYWLSVSLLEISSYMADARYSKQVQNSKRLSKSVSKIAGSNNNGSPKASSGNGDLLLSSSSSPSFANSTSVGPVESTANPMFVTANGLGAASNSSKDNVNIEFVQSLQTAPDTGMWLLIRDQFMTMAKENTELVAQMRLLKREVAQQGSTNNSYSEDGGSGSPDQDDTGNSTSPLGSSRQRRSFAPRISTNEGTSSSTSTKQSLALSFKSTSTMAGGRSRTSKTSTTSPGM